MSGAARPRERLDSWLVSSGLVESREKAQGLVLAGRVRVDGTPVTKSGARVPPGARVELAGSVGPVGRGAHKLEAALETFSVSVAGRVAVDVGASTGGFTEVLLARGALRVYAVDVGYGQLHERLRADPRVVLRERVNARRLGSQHVAEACGVASMDVSFISVLKLLPALLPLLEPAADVLVLVKPQFEVGRFEVGRRGIVKDPGLHRRALLDVARGARGLGYAVLGACASPITGAQGNREFFLHLRPGESGLEAQALEAAVEAALRP